MPTRLLAQLDRHAADRPDALAVSLVKPDRSDGIDAAVTWRQLLSAVESFARQLRPALSPGDVLMLCGPNTPAFSAAFLAGLAAGLRVFPVSPMLTAAELRAAAVESCARGIVGSPEALAAVDVQVTFGWPDVTADHSGAGASTGLLGAAKTLTVSGRGTPEEESAMASEGTGPTLSALLLHSSGTTGMPKIVVRLGESLDLVSEAMAESVGLKPTDRVVSCVPLCHSYGLEHGLLAPLWAGAEVRLCPGFDLPTVISELDAGGTVFPGVPFVYETLARQAAGRRWPALRRAYSAGGPLPAAVREEVSRQLGVTVTQLYGATEIGSVTYSDPDLPGFAPDSVGRAMRGVEIVVTPPESNDPTAAVPVGVEGHIHIRSAYRFDGYLGNAEPMTADGFFATGDLGRLDGFGNLSLTGRIKLLIDVAGLKVNPLEVEATLNAHPAVAECVVVPLPVTQTVSRLKAVVVRSPDESVDAETLRQYLKQRLAPHKVPRVFEFRETLPRSAAGKLLRQGV